MLRIGQKVEGIVYNKRPCAYVIIEREEDSKIVIATDEVDVYFFLGGGIENNETAEDAVRREVIEEAGYTLKNIKFFDRVTAWCYSDNLGYTDVDATIFIANFDELITEPIEKDHEILWIDSKDYKDKLYHEYQRYILNKYVQQKNIADYE